MSEPALRTALSRMLRQTVENSADVDDEIAHLMKSLASTP